MNDRIPWRDHLTPDEAVIIAEADAAKEVWQRLNASRAGIVNRAIRRAQYRHQAAATNDAPTPERSPTSLVENCVTTDEPGKAGGKR